MYPSSSPIMLRLNKLDRLSMPTFSACTRDTTTILIMTLLIMTLLMMTLLIMTLLIMTLLIMILLIMT
jgi:hypothetical protein